jgi:hypothetical protein
MEQTIEVMIDSKGNVTIEVNGMKGVGCKEITDEIVRSLGGDVNVSNPKPDYYYELDGIEVKQGIS